VGEKGGDVLDRRRLAGWLRGSQGRGAHIVDLAELLDALAWGEGFVNVHCPCPTRAVESVGFSRVVHVVFGARWAELRLRISNSSREFNSPAVKLPLLPHIVLQCQRVVGRQSARSTSALSPWSRIGKRCLGFGATPPLIHQFHPSSSSLQHSHSLTPVTNSPLSISGISIHRNTLIRQPPAHRIGSRVTTIYGNGAFRETRLGLDSTLAPALHHAPIEWEVEPIAIAATIFLSLNVRIDISFIHSHRHVKPGSSGCRAGVGWSALHWAASVGRRSWHRCSSSDDGLGQPAICSKPQPDCEYHNHSRPDSLSPLFSFLFWRSGHCTKPSASQAAQHHGRD
jgi:hypothetical protein